MLQGSEPRSLLGWDARYHHFLSPFRSLGGFCPGAFGLHCPPEQWSFQSGSWWLKWPIVYKYPLFSAAGNGYWLPCWIDPLYNLNIFLLVKHTPTKTASLPISGCLLFSYCCCNSRKSVSQSNAHWLSDSLEGHTCEIGHAGLKPSCQQQGCTFSIGSGGRFCFMPWLASWVCAPSSTHGPLPSSKPTDMSTWLLLPGYIATYCSRPTSFTYKGSCPYVGAIHGTPNNLSSLRFLTISAKSPWLLKASSWCPEIRTRRVLRSMFLPTIICKCWSLETVFSLVVKCTAHKVVYLIEILFYIYILNSECF